MINLDGNGRWLGGMVSDELFDLHTRRFVERMMARELTKYMCETTTLFDDIYDPEWLDRKLKALGVLDGLGSKKRCVFDAKP